MHHIETLEGQTGNTQRAAGKGVCTDESWIWTYDQINMLAFFSKSTFLYVQNLTLFVS